VPPTPGRGGPQHKFLQHFFREWAQDHGWRATIEEAVIDGAGSVDITFRKGELAVACEIGMSTTAEHELGNIEKCLTTGFHAVVLVSERKTLNQVRDLAEGTLTEDQRTRVHYRTREELFELLEELEAQGAGTEGTVRGYKVRVKRRALSSQETAATRQRLGQVLANAMKRLRPKE
jgi:hypothetical protein